jgi:hypothetical protein
MLKLEVRAEAKRDLAEIREHRCCNHIEFYERFRYLR